MYPTVCLLNPILGRYFFYLQDFRQREDDYARRKNAQSARRCFYFGPKEIKETGNLIYAQNKYAHDGKSHSNLSLPAHSFIL